MRKKCLTVSAVIKCCLSSLCIYALLLTSSAMLTACGCTAEFETAGGTENTDDGENTGIEDKAIMSINENNGIAEVTAENGLKYTAEGYSSCGEDGFTVRKGMTVRFGEQFNGAFNRITLSYTASIAMKCTLTYEIDGSPFYDTFYLEAGTHSFRGLISGYLEGTLLSALTEMKIATCSGYDGTFALYAVNADVLEVISSDVFYIENGRYKLGIRLAWGGGICYLSDSAAETFGLNNLINQADTGRLVQQSYYGTGTNSEYKAGTFNGAGWSYNPVQGGDVYGNTSRIIDIEIRDGSLYIKAQPQDWALNGQITPSYMENLYTLEEDHIRVDNRFIDFSGWSHRFANQELPAFYTLSYFDTFSYYNGSEPWSDMPLISRNDLNFWGDINYHDDCVFRLNKDNSETWCAWTNGEIDYGIGIYVPNIDMYLAGRFSYNGSKEATSSSTNYVAPINTLKLVSYNPIEYSYIITTGSLEKIRSVFKSNQYFAANESLHKNYRSERTDKE